MTENSKRRTNVGRVALALALALALGSWASWAAAPAEAIAGGREADHTYGQVQFYITSGEGDPGEYVCAGTLINPKWVLTAKHCIEGYDATVYNSFVLAGDTRLKYGGAHTIEDFHLHEDYDAALLELEDEAAGEVVGYSTEDPDVDTLVDIAGWGSEPSPTEQVATMLTTELDWEGATEGDGLLFQDIGQGIAERGDSGAGVHPHGTGLIAGVVKAKTEDESVDPPGVSAVPTSDLAAWIQQTSGVAPSDSLDLPPGEDEPSESDSSRGRGSGRGGSGANTGAALAELTQSVQNADKDVQDLVSRLGEAYPGYNVMVIQQETYSGPTDIRGVQGTTTVEFGTNTFDVWVFESGSFTNEGDLGWDNWGWSGSNWTRSEDQHTVTFEPIE